jgi:hypothetical protein
VVSALARGDVRLGDDGRARGVLRTGAAEASFALLQLPDEPLARTLDAAIAR